MPDLPDAQSTMSIADTDAPWPSSRILSVCVALLCITVLVRHASSFLPFISDDALISLRYSQRLLEGHGLTWTEGHRVEGYTNLLWVLACAGLGLAGVDLIDAARILGFAGMAAAIAAIVYAYRPRRPVQTLAPLAGGLALALTAPFAVWAIGGMEQPFVATFLAWANVLALPLIEKPSVSLRKALVPGFFLGLLCLTRSDGGVLCIAFALGIVAGRGLCRTSAKIVGGLAVYPVLMGGAQVIFRLAYYHEWLPNPAYVKLAFTGQRIQEGLRYVGDAAPYLAGLLVPALSSTIVGLAVRRPPRRTTFFAMQAVAWLAYVVLIGGDVFPAHRHWVPISVLAAMLIADLAAYLVGRGRFAVGSAYVGTAIMLAVIVLSQLGDPEVRRAKEERWEWEGQAVGEFLRRAFGQADPLIACDPAGCIPYFTRFRAIDMLGLNDYHIARHRTAEFGRGVLGHEVGDGKYVLDRQPDLILWNGPTGALHPIYPSGKEMAADPHFGRSYRLLFLAAIEPKPCGIWIRVNSPRVGIRALSSGLVVPGILAATSNRTPATLDDQDRLGVLVRSGQVATTVSMGASLDFMVPPGRWRVVVESDAPAGLRILFPYEPNRRAEGIGELALDAGGNGTAVDLVLWPVSTPTVHVRRVLFLPQPGKRP